jgi:hypothetical protein
LQTAKNGPERAKTRDFQMIIKAQKMQTKDYFFFPGLEET